MLLLLLFLKLDSHMQIYLMYKSLNICFHFLLELIFRDSRFQMFRLDFFTSGLYVLYILLCLCFLHERTDLPSFYHGTQPHSEFSKKPQLLEDLLSHDIESSLFLDSDGCMVLFSLFFWRSVQILTSSFVFKFWSHLRGLNWPGLSLWKRDIWETWSPSCWKFHRSYTSSTWCVPMRVRWGLLAYSCWSATVIASFKERCV